MALSQIFKGSVGQAVLHLFFLSKAKSRNVGREQYSEAIRKDFVRSFLPLLLVAIVAMTVLFVTNRVRWDLALHWGRLCSSLGAFLAGWATWYALADANESWGQDTPDELARTGVFKLLMWPGILLSVIGAAWWP